MVLKNLLHIPHVNKNLISVSQSNKDNHVYFEFYLSVCYVKTQETKQIIVQEKIKDILYVFLALVPTLNIV